MITPFPLFLRRLGGLAFFACIFSAASIYADQVAAPVLSPPPGTYTGAQTVTITSATAGVTIRCTTDGSTPTETNGLVYSGPVSIAANIPFAAIAYNAGFTDSAVTSGNYFIQAATPTFTPAAGLYSSVQSVAISSVTPGVSIAYTTDGSTPTESGGTVTHGALYSGAISVGASCTLSAIAFRSDLTDSAIGTATYSIFLPTAATPTFSPAAGTYTSVQSVTISSTSSGTSIAYTTDGSTPTESGGTVTHGILYSGAVPVGVTTTLKAIAFGGAFADSGLASAAYVINLPPAFGTAGGTYASPQSVAVTQAISGATIHYTTDGSTPTETNGTLYSGPVSISHSTILKAISYQPGSFDSPVTSAIYTITSSPAVILNVVRDFCGCGSSGTNSGATLVQGTDGNFYGTTEIGGANSAGTVFKVTSAGVLTTLTSFDGINGQTPFAGLTQGVDGNFYGPTYLGGSASLGGIFKITPAGVLTPLLSFNGANGEYPFANLIQGSDGNFYGTTNPVFFDPTNYGTVFKVTPAGVLTTLVLFNGTNGGGSRGGLVQGSDGNFYGTTYLGGSSSDGTIFKMTPAGILTTLVSFNGINGALPSAGLVQGSDGDFYGTTSWDSVNHDGTVFKMTSTGALATLAFFNGTNGQYPHGLVQGSDGNFYGLAESGGDSGNYGTVFKVTPAGILTALASFDGANGNGPIANLVQGSDGNFYGTTETGGVSNAGVIFQLIVPPSAVAPTFSPAAGAYTSVQNVTISTTTSGASIRYTTDGSTPTETNGTLYSGPVLISANTTLAAIAYKSGDTDSPVTSGTYTITLPAAPASPASSGGGGGGGAPSWWFLGALAFAALLRWKLGQKMSGESRKS
ncbi:MAG TPA: choice-of-anchor tandem repeat GloVer-containing protein [Opitutaceae bacterium]|jgi:uncharacterized repeat protein (TIGR03803 family)|nr:choice-of-anchor tandem repeat GloVer-containing protein [Opitutaceae bacterium]